MEGGDQIRKQAPELLKSFNYLSPQYHGLTQKKRYSLNELKALLSNSKARLNNDDPLSSHQYNSYDKLNVREVRNGDKDSSTTEREQDKNNIMAVSTTSMTGLDPPTSSVASNEIEQLSIHDKLNDQNDERGIFTPAGRSLDLNAAVSSHNAQGIDPPTQSMASLERLPDANGSIIKVYPTTSQSSLGQPSMDSHSSDQSDPTNWKVSSSKKNKPLELPRDYPLFDSPYPPPLMDGHLCRYNNDVIMMSFMYMYV